MALLSGGLQLADFVAVRADGGFPLGPAIDVSGMGNEAVQRLDTLGLCRRRHRSNAGGLSGLDPCLPQRPCEALAPDVRKLDLRIAKVCRKIAQARVIRAARSILGTAPLAAETVVLVIGVALVPLI